MATISTTLELVDRMSGRLTTIAGRVQALTDMFLQLDGCISRVQTRMEGLGTQDLQMNMPGFTLTGVEKVEVQEREVTEKRIVAPFVQTETPLAAAVMERPVPTVPEISEVQAEIRGPVMREIPEVQAEMRGLVMPEMPAVQAEMTAGISGDEAGFLTAIAGRIQAGRGLLAAAAGAAANTAVLAVQRIMQPAAAQTIGAYFAEGLARGIRSRIAAVAAAARATANAAVSAARTALDIHSPSREAEEIGAYFGAGFADGIDASGREVSEAAGRLSGMAYRKLDAPLWSGIRFFGELEQVKYEPDAEDVYLSDGDAKRLRSLAERETINHFTTAELHIDFTANNNINSNMDLDGVVTYLEDQLTERLQMAAEGVYS